MHFGCLCAENVFDIPNFQCTGNVPEMLTVIFSFMPPILVIGNVSEMCVQGTGNILEMSCVLATGNVTEILPYTVPGNVEISFCRKYPHHEQEV